MTHHGLKDEEDEDSHGDDDGDSVGGRGDIANSDSAIIDLYTRVKWYTLTSVEKSLVPLG